MEVGDDVAVLDAIAKTVNREITFQCIIQVYVRSILVQVWQIRQVVIVAAETLGQFHPASTCEVKGVVAHTQHLNFLH